MKESIIERIHEEYGATPEFIEKRQECNNSAECTTALEKFVKEPDDEDIFADVALKYEQFGFIQGFKCAMQLKKECEL